MRRSILFVLPTAVVRTWNYTLYSDFLRVSRGHMALQFVSSGEDAVEYAVKTVC